MKDQFPKTLYIGQDRTVGIYYAQEDIRCISDGIVGIYELKEMKHKVTKHELN